MEIDQSLFIKQLELELENQLNEVLEVFQNLPDFNLLNPSSTGGWSIAQCFEHLNTYASFYLPRLRESLAQASNHSPSSIYKHTWLGNYFINMMDAGKSRKKFKAIKRHRPGTIIENPSLAVSMFIEHLEELSRLLKEANKKELRKAYVSTSISSLLKINSGDALKFVLTHNRRHLEQAKRNS